jgi:nitric oxide reductase large subunit
MNWINELLTSAGNTFEWVSKLIFIPSLIGIGVLFLSGLITSTYVKISEHDKFTKWTAISCWVVGFVIWYVWEAFTVCPK